MTVALVEKTLRTPFKIDNLKIRTTPMKAINHIDIKKGTLMNAVVNINTIIKNNNKKNDKKKSRNDNGKDKNNKNSNSNNDDERYIRAYQDMIGWFIPLESGGTLLVAVMKADLGPDVPRFAFKTALAATVTWSMNALRNLCDRDSLLLK